MQLAHLARIGDSVTAHGQRTLEPPMAAKAAQMTGAEALLGVVKAGQEPNNESHCTKDMSTLCGEMGNGNWLFMTRRL